MATRRWETTFDLMGLTAYYMLMTGELPGDDLFETARKGVKPEVVELPRRKTRGVRKLRRQKVAA